MAISIFSQKTHKIPLQELSREQFLVLAIEAAQREDWSIGHTTSNGFSAFTGFSLSSFSEEITIKIQEETALIKSECIGTQLYDWGKNNRNLKNFQRNFREIKESLTEEQLADRYQYLQQEHAFSNEQEALTAEEFTNTSFFSLFVPARGYFITPILVNINLLVFIIMAALGVNILEPGNQDLLNWGANFQPQTLEGQPWRLFTCFFLHIGIFHLLMNMYALVYIGSLLEPLLGRSRFLIAYLATGLLASLTSVWWHSYTVSAGASGAIFGMYGVFLALLFSNYIERSARKAFLTSIGLFVGYNLLNGLKPGIDNAAHLGGLISGMAIGFTFLYGLKYSEDKKLQNITLFIIALASLLIVGGVYKILPNNIKIYQEKMQQFNSMENMALEIFNLPEAAPKEQKLNEITSRGFYYWNENLKIVDDIAALNLPEPILEQNKLVRKYCELRIKSYELLFKIIKEEDPDRYDALYQRYNAQIRGLIERIK